MRYQESDALSRLRHAWDTQTSFSIFLIKEPDNAVSTTAIAAWFWDPQDEKFFKVGYIANSASKTVNEIMKASELYVDRYRDSFTDDNCYRPGERAVAIQCTVSAVDLDDCDEQDYDITSNSVLPLVIFSLIEI